MALLRSGIPVFLLLLLSAGCTGTIESDNDGTDGNTTVDGTDAGSDPGADTAGDQGQDAGGDPGPLADGDAGDDAADSCNPDCTGKQCGDDGCGGECGPCTGTDICVDFQCSTPGPCDNVTCEEEEWCLDGICRCQSGWERQADACQPVVPLDFAVRTAQNVCDKWNADYPDRAAWVWEEGPVTCDNGTLNPEAIDDGIRRINLYRWLVGLYPVYNRRDLNVYAQPCALMIKEHGSLSHEPTIDWDCYTDEGATGASHSNEAQGPHTPSGAMDAYIQDNRVDSLGHRRWLLDPPYLPSGIGHTTGWNCTYVMTGGNTSTADWVAYPGPGPFPLAGILGKWSLGVWGLDSENTTVTVRDLTAGGEEQPAFYFPGGWYGSYSYIAFTPSGITAGHDYEVTVTHTRTGSQDPVQDIVYTVQVTDCTQY